MIINHIHTYGTVCHAIMFLITLYLKFIKPKNKTLNFNNLIILFFLLGHLLISIFLGVINVYSDNQKFYIMGIFGHIFLFIHMALQFLNIFVFNKSLHKNIKLDYHLALNILFIVSQVVMIIRYSYFKKDIKYENNNNDDNDEKNKGIKLTPLIMLSLFYLLHLFVNKNYIMKLVCIILSLFYLLLFIAEYQI